MLLSQSIAVTVLFSAFAVVHGTPISVDSTTVSLGTRGDIVDIYARGGKGAFFMVDFKAQKITVLVVFTHQLLSR
jgi:hypothetical protein